MRFIITGEWDRNRVLRLIIVLYLVFVALYVATAALMYFDRMGLSPASVSSYYLGDPDQEFGRPAKAYGSMVQDAHMHMFAMGMLALVLTHLLLFVPLSPRMKVRLTIVTFFATLMNEVSSWLVRFVSASLAFVKVGSFVLMELSLSALVIVLFFYTLRPTRNAYKDTAK